MNPKHDEDFYGWAVNTAFLLKNHQYDEVDMDSVIEEVLKMGASDKHALTSYLRELLLHLLKWEYQPSHKCKSWQISINKQRDAVLDILEYSPGLKQFLPELQKNPINAHAQRLPYKQGLTKTHFQKTVHTHSSKSWTRSFCRSV